MSDNSSNHLPMAMHHVREAIELDDSGKIKEAYYSYLNSMSFIISTLRNEFSNQEFAAVCNQDTTKLLKLVQCCQERATDIISTFQKNVSSTSHANGYQRKVETNTDPATANTGTLDKLIMSLPTPPSRKKSFNSTPRRAKSVNNVDKIQSRQMFQAYQRRLSIQRHQPNQNLTSFRKTVEDLMLEKARRKAFNLKLEERRKKIRLKAEQRFSDKTGSRATDAALEKEIYAKVLEFEQETTWPQKLREKLSKEPENIRLIEEIVTTVLSVKEHPLGQQMAEMQYALYRELSVFVANFAYPFFKLGEGDLVTDDKKNVVKAKGENVQNEDKDLQESKQEIETEELKDEGTVNFVIDEGSKDSRPPSESSQVEMVTESGTQETISDIMADESGESSCYIPGEDFKPEEYVIDGGKEVTESGGTGHVNTSRKRFLVPISNEKLETEFHDFEESMMEDLDYLEDFDSEELLPLQEVDTGGSLEMEAAERSSIGSGEAENVIENWTGNESKSAENPDASVTEGGSSNSTIDANNILDELAIIRSHDRSDNGGLDTAEPTEMAGKKMRKSEHDIGEEEGQECHANAQDVEKLKGTVNIDDNGEENNVNGIDKAEDNCDHKGVATSQSDEVKQEGILDGRNETVGIAENADDIEVYNRVDDEKLKEETSKSIELISDNEIHDFNKNQEQMDDSDDEMPKSLCVKDVTEGSDREDIMKTGISDTVADTGSSFEVTNEARDGSDCGDIENEMIDELFSNDSSEEYEILPNNDLTKVNTSDSKSDSRTSDLSEEKKEEFLNEDVFYHDKEELSEKERNLLGNIGESSKVEICNRTADEDSSCQNADQGEDANKSEEKIKSEDESKENSKEEISPMKIVTKEKDEFSTYRAMTDSLELRRTLEKIVKNIHASLNKLHSLLIITYDELDLPIGRDQSYASVESVFFKPLWQWVNLAFRRLNVKKEVTLYEIIKKRWNCSPKEFFIREKYTLKDSKEIASNYPYKSAVEELKKIVTYSSPLDKLECIVLTTKLICQCVTDYWIAKGDSQPPTVGCDDLLPILTYVIVKAALPQLVSECHAMEEFIHESYLLGEEGYCLTTLSTAIAYSLTLKDKDELGDELNL